MIIPAYEDGLPDPNPPFDLFQSGRFNYPYTLRNNLTDKRVDKAWRALWLENQYLKCLVLPDLGGHLYSCTDKRNGRERESPGDDKPSPAYVPPNKRGDSGRGYNSRGRGQRTPPPRSYDNNYDDRDHRQRYTIFILILK